MVNVAEKLQAKYEKWLSKLTESLVEGENIDEDRAFELFWIRMNPEDAVEVLRYNG